MAMGIRGYIDSREDFKEYVLRALGQPVVHIEMDDEQLEDAVDDTLQIYYDWGNEGMIQTFRKVVLTDELIAANLNVREMSLTAEDSETAFDDYGIPVSDDVYGVSSVFMLPNAGQNMGLFSSEYQYMMSQFDMLYGTGSGSGMGSAMGNGSLTSIVSTRQFISDINMVVGITPLSKFSYVRKRIYLETDWRRMSAGSWLLFEVYQLNDPNYHTAIWNLPTVKKLCTALAKKRWGQNLKKFSGVTMPGGVSINGDQLYQDGDKELQEAMNELKKEQCQMIHAFHVG